MITWLKKLIQRFQRLIKFGAVGVVNTAVDYGVFALLNEVLGLPSGWSHAASFMAGSVCGYLLNSNVTFREGKGRSRAQWVQYIGIDVVLTVLSSFAMQWLTDLGLNRWVVKIGLTGAVFVIHYFLHKYVVFRIRKEDDA